MTPTGRRATAPNANTAAAADVTALELLAWSAYVETGSMRLAAKRLGVHEITVRKRIAALRDSYNVRNNVQLAIAIERDSTDVRPLSA